MSPEGEKRVRRDLKRSADDERRWNTVQKFLVGVLLMIAVLVYGKFG